MRHRVARKHLGRTTSHRKALRRNMAASLFQHGAIRTTTAKAKMLKPFVEKLITVARKGTLHARRRIIAILGDRRIVDVDGNDDGQTIVMKLIDEIAPKYANRPGGYTRIIRLTDRRIGDAGKIVLLQLVEDAPAQEESEGTGKKSRRRRRAAKRAQAAKTETADAAVTDAPADADSVVDETPAADEQENTDQAEANETPAEDKSADAEEGTEKPKTE